MGLLSGIKAGIANIQALENERKAKHLDAEVDAKRQLSNCPLLNLLVANLINDEENPWITTCQSYYDDCRRMVLVGEDFFEVKWFTTHLEEYEAGQFENGTPIIKQKEVEDIHGYLRYSYTQAGYMPLHEYTKSFSLSNGETQTVTLGLPQIRDLWASVVMERMADAMPNAEFTTSKIIGAFWYKVPRPIWKDWFE